MTPASFPLTALSRIVFVVALAVGLWLSLQPAPDIPRWLDWQDKLEHVAFFVLLALLGMAGWPAHMAALAAGLLGYGLVMEVAQSFTDYRRGDPWDWAADACGVAAGLLLARALRGRRVRRTA
jgi:VanZ family protein